MKKHIIRINTVSHSKDILETDMLQVNMIRSRQYPILYKCLKMTGIYGYIEDINFFEVNTKYISSSALKKAVFSRVRSTSENADISTTRDEIYLVFAEKKVNFLFILYSTELKKAQPNFSPGRFLFDLTFSVCLLGTTLGVNKVCKSYFNG